VYKTDIGVVGAGPAGSHLAFRLAKEGRDVLLLDDSHPREKPCGGGISVLALQKFPSLNDYRSLGHSTDLFQLISPRGRIAKVSGNKEGFIISRRILDEALLKKALSWGARLIPAYVREIERDGDRWILGADGERVECRILIGADGVHSLVRRRVIGKIPIHSLSLTSGYFITGYPDDIQPIIKFTPFRGYIWAFPRLDHASVGGGGPTEKAKIVKASVKEFLDSFTFNFEIIGKWTCFIPFISNPKFFDLPCAGEDWILIGDAAGHVDPITGEGILYALWSADLAADAILNSNISEYDVSWRKEYGKHLKIGSRLSKIFYKSYVIETIIKIASRNRKVNKLLYGILGSELSYDRLWGELLPRCL